MKSFSRLTYHNRVLIETRYCVDQKSMRSIAIELKRPTSAISREIAGNPRFGRGKYNADRAQKIADTRKHKQGRNTKMIHEPLRVYVIKKLKIGWSPEQIEIRLPLKYPKDTAMRISYEAIYQYVYAQIHRGGHGAVKPGCEDLRPYLPRRHKRRMAKGFRKVQKTERRAGLPSIDDRPEVVEARTRIGDWEDDFLVSNASRVCVKSANERMSGVVFFGRTTDGTAKAGDLVLFEKLNQIPQKYRKTLTRDNGSENKDWKTVQATLGLSVYFAHPYHSWERGSNENCNGLLRRFFPKGTDWSIISDEAIARAEYLINSRPRKRHGGLTPYEFFYQETGVALDS
ncbi:MAG: IS30 family transposase [Candidatus Azotimanducaceae bacterium]|jgi:IS30 family transposase